MLYGNYLKEKYRNVTDKTSEAEGVPCDIDNSKGKNIRDYKIYGNSIQDGTPTPESPIDIQSVGDLVTDAESEHYGKYYVPIHISGQRKNIFPGLIKGTGLNSANGAVMYHTNYATSKYIQVDYKGNGNYYISGLPTTLTHFVAAYNANKEFLGRTGGAIAKDRLLTVSMFAQGTAQGTGDIAYLRVTCYKTSANTGTIDDIDDAKIQLEPGSTATEYEPYKGSMTTHIYLDEPLRKVGDIADYIDFKNQKAIRQVEVLDDSGTKAISESLGVLTSPTEENISLPNLKTYKGTNVIATGTAIQPSNIKIKYVRM